MGQKPGVLTPHLLTALHSYILAETEKEEGKSWSKLKFQSLNLKENAPGEKKIILDSPKPRGGKAISGIRTDKRGKSNPNIFEDKLNHKMETNN